MAKDALEKLEALIRKHKAVAKSDGKDDEEEEKDPSMKAMGPEEFLDHALGEVAKAAEEEPDVARKRLGTLAKGVEIMKAASWENTDRVNVPVFHDKVTADKDETEKELAGGGPAQQPGGSNWVAKGDDRTRRNRLAKVKGDPAVDGEGWPEDMNATGPGKRDWDFDTEFSLR